MLILNYIMVFYVALLGLQSNLATLDADRWQSVAQGDQLGPVDIVDAIGHNELEYIGDDRQPERGKQNRGSAHRVCKRGIKEDHQT